MLVRAAYVAPAILTLAASPAFAQRGSFAPVRSGGVPYGLTIAPGPNNTNPPGLSRAPGQQQ
jgi:hypothetical protein